MPSVDVKSLLEPVSPAEPTGSSLEYSPEYSEFERAAQGRSEQRMGETVIAAEEADWSDVAAKAAALLGKTKDLRIACLLARALAKRQGYAGLSAGLEVIGGLIERYWEGLHPRLDPDDGNDPAIRLNALMSLCEPDMLNSLRSAPLITSRSFGPITLRDVAVAAGQADAPEGGRKIDQAGLDAAFREAGPEAVSSILKVASGAAVHLRALDAVVGTHTGGATAGLSKLAQLLGEATRAAKAHAALDDDGGSDTQATGSGDGAPAARAGLPGTITSRDDVVAALDRICAYYEQNEPANPIPLMLARCKRLVTMSFLDIVRDMAPDAVTQIELIAGKRES